MKRAGQSLVESAFVLAAFMGLLVGIGTAGESLFVRQTLADRARVAARWGALNNYDPAAIQRVVLFGTDAPSPGQVAFLGLTPAAIQVSNPGCPGAACRVSVSIPAHGVRAVEPVEPSSPDRAASQP